MFLLIIGSLVVMIWFLFKSCFWLYLGIFVFKICGIFVFGMIFLIGCLMIFLCFFLIIFLVIWLKRMIFLLILIKIILLWVELKIWLCLYVCFFSIWIRCCFFFISWKMMYVIFSGIIIVFLCFFWRSLLNMVWLLVVWMMIFGFCCM